MENYKNLYEILRVPSTASSDEIKKAYQQLALEYHPDKRGNDASKFIEIDEAWKILRDPNQRKSYDAQLRQSAFDEKPIIHENVTKSDFTFDNESNIFYHKCRCGGIYIMPDEDELNQETENVYIACDECSLVIELEKG